jgi:DNA-binding LytR/AlgR family response regulator
MHHAFTAGVGRAVSMSQSEISGSSEIYGIEEFIPVRRWLADPDHSDTGRVDRDQPPVLLARSAVVFVRVKGHFLHLHTVTGDEYVRRGTLKSLHRRWAEYGLVRIHNKYLVFLSHVRELRHESKGPAVSLGSGAGTALLPISRQRFQEFTRLREARGTQ